MAVQVATPEANYTHDDATKWHIDDNGFLHLRNDTSVVAVYNSISWTSATAYEPTSGETRSP